MNDNEKKQVFIKQGMKQNKLHIDYELSEAELNSDLYQNYIAIKGKKATLERYKYLLDQEKIYKDKLALWAQYELKYRRELHKIESQKNRKTNTYRERKQAENKTIKELRKKIEMEKHSLIKRKKR